MGVRTDRTPTTFNARWWAFLLSGKPVRNARVAVSAGVAVVPVTGRDTVSQAEDREAVTWNAVHVALISLPMPVSVIGADYPSRDPGQTGKASASR